MSKRAFIIHGWGGNPNKDWIPWVVLQLKEKGYEVRAPLMPDTDYPQIEPWVSKPSRRCFYWTQYRLPNNHAFSG